jgi:hypothetical protein
LVLIAIVVVVIVTTLGSAIQNIFSEIGSALLRPPVKTPRLRISAAIYCVPSQAGVECSHFSIQAIGLWQADRRRP